MLTRAAPVASAARSDSSSRMPPDSSTFTSSRRDHLGQQVRRWSPGRTRRRGRPGGPTRAPSRCQASAASSGSPYAVSVPAAPCTSRTAWPSATSTAGSRVRVTVFILVPVERSRAITTTPAAPAATAAISAIRSARSSTKYQISASAASGDHARWRPAAPRAAPGEPPGPAPPAAAASAGDQRAPALPPGRRRARRASPRATARGLAARPAAGPAPCSPAHRPRGAAHSVREPVAQQRGARRRRTSPGGTGSPHSGPCSTAATNVRAVVGGGHQRRRPSSQAPGRAPRTSGRSRTARPAAARRTAPTRPARRPCSSPCAARRRAASRVTAPGSSPSPW